MLISRETAWNLLSPHLAALRECILGGWAAWEEFAKKVPDFWLASSKRTRANFVYDQVCRLVRQRFDDVKGVRILEERGFLLLDIEGKVLIRFKKLNASRRSSYIPTAYQRQFFAQEELPGMPPQATRLVAGYQLDELGTAVEDVLITCPVETTIEWYFSIGQQPGAVISLPSPATAEPPAPKVRVKKDLKRKKEVE